jgi:hypothetical protein
MNWQLIVVCVQTLVRAHYLNSAIYPAFRKSNPAAHPLRIAHFLIWDD